MLLMTGLCAPAQAAIFSCQTAQGTRILDRPMPGCIEQWELNADGSRKRRVEDMKSDEERARDEERQRREAAERAASQAEERRDQNLVNRFPDKARHDLARRDALDNVDRAIQSSNVRVEKLKAERKPLLEEAEFYVGKPLPFKLRIALDGNDAAMEAQQGLIVNQLAEKERIDQAYDAQLAKLKTLWERRRRP